MRTSAQIKDQLDICQKQISRVSKMIQENPDIENQKYVKVDGTTDEFMTYGDVLQINIAKRSAFQFCLGHK